MKKKLSKKIKRKGSKINQNKSVIIKKRPKISETGKILTIEKKKT